MVGVTRQYIQDDRVRDEPVKKYFRFILKSLSTCRKVSIQNFVLFTLSSEANQLHQKSSKNITQPRNQLNIHPTKCYDHRCDLTFSDSKIHLAVKSHAPGCDLWGLQHEAGHGLASSP